MPTEPSRRFPTAAELAEMEGESVPAAGFALFPESEQRTSKRVWAWTGAALVAGLAIYKKLLSIRPAS